MNLNFQAKLIVFAVGIVLISTIILSTLFVDRYNNITNYAVEQNRQGTEAISAEYLNTYANDQAGLASLELRSAIDTLSILGRYTQTVIDNRSQLLSNQELFELDVLQEEYTTYEGSLITDSSEPFDVLVAPSIREASGSMELVQLSSLLNLVMPAAFEANNNSTIIYYIGDKEAPVVRLYPNIGLAKYFETSGLSQDTIFWRDFFAPNVAGWERYFQETDFQEQVITQSNTLVTYEPPYNDAAGQGQIITLFYPLWDHENDNFEGVVALDLSLNKIIENILSVKVAESGYAFLITSSGQIVAMPEQGHEELKIDLEEKFTGNLTYYIGSLASAQDQGMQSIYPQILAQDAGLVETRLDNGTDVRVAFASLSPLNDIAYSKDSWKVVIVVPETEILASLYTTQAAISERGRESSIYVIAIVALVLVVASLGGVWMSNRITAGLKSLTLAANQISQGQFDVQATIQSQDELGQLADTFNLMTTQLRESFNKIGLQNTQLNQQNMELKQLNEQKNQEVQQRQQAQRALERLNLELEERVSDRTRDMQIATNVSRQITTVLDIDDLIQQVVRLVTQEFRLHAMAVYLWDETRQGLVKHIGSSQAHPGQLFLQHQTNNAVSIAAYQKQTMRVDPLAQPQYRDSVLSNTKTQVAIPMLLGQILVGVVDMQSEQAGHFQDDELKVLTALTEQITVAVRNAELFTEVRMAQAQAEQANRIKSQFLAHMSHELRTPLNAVINFSEFVSSGLFGEVNAEQKDALERIQSSGEHLLSLINDVLDISKIEAGALHLFVEDQVDLVPEIHFVVGTARSLLRDKPVEVITQIDPMLPVIRADRQRITQILLNLISNACKFTHQGRISLIAQAQDNEIVISVRDSGPGIQPEEQAAIFQTFVQTSTGIREGSGTGLGLPISKNLAEMHGGKLWVESIPGDGATFYLQLPVCSDSLIVTPI